MQILLKSPSRGRKTTRDPQALAEIKRARQYQREQLPPAIATAGCEAAAGILPDRWVSGDYVDVAPLTGDRTFFCVADACGKGMPAAMAAAEVRAIMRCLLEMGMGLGQCLARLNAHVCRSRGTMHFVTVSAAILDHRTRELTYVNAGHPAMLRLASGRHWEKLDAPLGCLPLGIETSVTMHEHRVTLGAGDLLVTYSDGCTDRRGPMGEPLGPQGLCDTIDTVIAQRPRASLQELVEASLRRLEKLGKGSRVRDDAGILLVRVV
jgi:phosphoserine phosphatase RsbU/P